MVPHPVIPQLPGMSPKPKVADFGAILIQSEMRRVGFALENHFARRVSSEQMRERMARDQEIKLKRRAELKHRRELRCGAALLIQAAWRRQMVFKHVMPMVRERRRLELLARGRTELSGSLLALTRQMHQLVYLSEHKRAAATRIQAWWRGVLGVRAVVVILMRLKVKDVYARMGAAACKIQSMFRGIRGRDYCRLKKVSLEAMRQKVQQARDEHVQTMAVRLQCFARCVLAKLSLVRRRAKMSESLMATKESTAMSSAYIRASVLLLNAKDRFVDAPRQARGRRDRQRRSAGRRRHG